MKRKAYISIILFLLVVFKVYGQPQGGITANGPFCATGTGQLTWTATAGTGPYTVIYNDGTADRTKTGAVSGTPFNVFGTTVTSTTTYTLVSVTDESDSQTRSSGFTGSTTATITVNSLPAATASATTPLCAGGTLNLTGGPGSMTTYAWTGPNGYTNGTQSPSIAGVAAANAGVYTLTVTDGNGCSNSASTASVVVNSLPTATASATTPLCAGGTLNLTGGPGSMTTYAWTGPNGYTNGTQSPSIAGVAAANAGVYTLTVTDGNGCSNSASTASVVVNSLPTATASATTPLCAGGTLNLTGGPGSMTTYAWTGPNGYTNGTQSPSIAGVAAANAGVYTLTVTDGNGCSNSASTASVVVNSLPVATASATTPLCAGGTLNLTGGPGSMTTYAWTGPNGYTNGTQSPSIAGVAAANAGVYTLTVTDGNGCSNSASTASVVVNSLPTATASATTPLCAGGTLNLTGGPGSMTTYAWTGPNGYTNGTQSPSIAGVAAANAGVYTLTVTDGNGCSNSASTASVVVNSLPVATASATTPLCAGGTLNLTGGPGSMTTYAWTGPNGYTNGTQSPSISGVAAANAGVYTLTVTDGNGCSKSASTASVVVNPLPAAITGEPDVCIGSTTTLADATGGGSWSSGTTSVATVNSSTGVVTGVAAGTSVISYTLGTGCESTLLVTVNPSGQVNDPSDQALCNGATTTAVNFSTSQGGGVTTYFWTNDQPSIGLAASSSGDISAFTAINAGTAPVIATVTVTPHYKHGNVTCIGTPQTFTITVNPTPTVNSAPSKTICDNSSVNYNITSATASTTYTWTASIITTPSGGTITGFSNCNSGCGTNIGHTLDNTGISKGVVRYVITPTGPTGCPGTPFNFDVTVNPTALVNDPADLVRCHNTSASVTFGTTNTGGTMVYNWTNSQPGIGLAGSGTGDIASFTATNTGITPVTATITVTPSYDGCPGTPQTFTITVNPLPTLSGVSQNAQICSGSAAQINLTGLLNPSTSTIAYSINAIDQTSITGLVSAGGSANFNTDNLPAINNGKPLVIKTITNETTGCSATFGTSTLLIVNSATVPTITESAAPCIGSAVTYTTEPGMTSYVWQITGGVLGTDYSKTGGTGTDNTITITWLTPMTHHVKVNYTNVNNCSVGSPTDKTVTVNALPSPTITSGPASVCIGSTGNAYVTQSGMLNYLWDVPAGGIITSGGAGNVIVVTWNTAGSHLVRVKYSSVEGCPATAYTDYPVIVNALPVPTFTAGPLTPRVTSTGNVYSTQTGMSNYVWTVSGGGTITSGGTSGSSSATVTWNSTGAQTVSVSYTNGNNCTASAPDVRSVTVNPLPSVSNVQISGTAAIGFTLTGSYTYSDGGSGSNVSTYRWIRNGSTTVGTLSSYVVQAADLNSTLTFEVTPVTSVGPPNTGTPVTSSATLPVENLSEIPVADQVCIEGVRSAGSILKGKYRYTHSKPEGASVCKWYIDGVYAATGTTYTLLSADIDNNENITFEVTPVSSNIIPVIGTTAVSENPLAKVPLLPVEYSVAVTSVTLTATPSDGIFSGPGVTNGIFNPNSVGLGGPYAIQYQRIIVNSGTTCSQKVIKNVDVVTNTTDFGSFDSYYCNDIGPDIITVTGVPVGSTSLGFTCTDPDAIVSSTDWTVTIDPRKMSQGTNVDILYFRYKDALGFISSINRPFVIDEVGKNIQIINLSAEYCEGTPKVNISVTGATPSGGTGAWTGTVLTDLTATTAAVNVAQGTPGQTYPITYQYTTPLGCKSVIIPGSVKINPLPNPAFLLNQFYNLDGGSVDLIPVQPNGTFSGDGVSGNKLFPDIAGLGEHTINYFIRDNKNCASSKDIKTIVKKAQGSFILSNGNAFPSVICYRDTTLTVSATGLPGGFTVNSFTNTRNSIVHVSGSTSATYNVPAAGEGLDTLIFSYKLDAVDYRISAVVNIDSLGLAEFVEFPGDKICDNIAPFKLNATPTGGVFSGPVAGNYLDPAQPAGANSVTYKYTNQKTGCSISKTLPFTIIPAPQVSFVPKDVCIDSGTDTTFFLNTTISSDPVASWLWTFAEVGAAPETIKEPGYLYKTGGIHSVSLRAVTASGCIVTKTSNIDLGLQPRGNFTWKNDCYSTGAKLNLFDATVSDLIITSRTWNFNNGSFISSDLNTEYAMPDTGIVNVKYIVRTNYANCADTVIQNIYLRPTVSIPADGFYKESFETGKNGWGKDESDIRNSWQFGKPDREVINSAASGASAWFTRYDILKQVRESSSVISPCFDFTNIKRPMIILNTFKRFDKNRDGAALQYRAETDTAWNYVGTLDDGIGWFNSTLISGKPGGDKTGWTTIGDPETKWNESRHSLDSLKGKKNVKFRISYGSDGSSQNNEGIAFDDIWIGERTRKVLLEHFTNTNSKQGNDATALVDKVISGKENDVITVQYHTNFPDDDPFYTANPGDASARIFSYGLSRVPYTLIDGGFSNDEYASLADYKTIALDTNDVSRRSLMNSRFSLSVIPKITGEVLSVNCSVTSTDVFASDNLVLYLVVTEKKNNSQTGSLKDKVFLNVFRKFIPDAGGVELKKSWTKGETFSVPVQTWVVQNVKKPSDIEVIAFIQNTQTKEIYQAGSEVLSTAKSAISISSPNDVVLAPENQKEIKEISFGMYPNPVISKLTIDFSSELPADADIRIYDFQGALKASYKAASGESEFIIEDISLKAGIYLVRISSGGIDLGYRKLIVSGE